MTHSTGPAAIEFRGVTYSYPDGTLAMDAVDLTVSRGARVALLGPNGAGKSTLILHSNGVLRPASGSILVGGVEITDATVAAVRSRVALVFQDPDDQLFMTTVHDDVAFGPLNMGLPIEEVDERVHEALHAVGLADLASKAGQHLSYGQKKRAALATVMSMRPAVLALDEPTSNLDPRARRAMIDLIARQDATVLLATHDMELARELCERAVVMDDGRVVAEGPAEEIMSDRALLEEHGLAAPGDTGTGGRREPQT